MNKITTLIAATVIILMLFLVTFKESIFCPYCSHFFTIVKIRQTDKLKFKTDWLGCSHCKKVFAYTYNGEVEKAYKSTGTFSYKEVNLE